MSAVTYPIDTETVREVVTDPKRLAAWLDEQLRALEPAMQRM